MKQASRSCGGEQVTVDPGGMKYLMSDRQGSTRIVMNGSGAVINRRDYQPFGQEISPETEGTRQQYGQLERDKNGLDHAGWRKYDSSAGRWTSPDPYMGSMRMGDPQSLNRYAPKEEQPSLRLAVNS